MENKIMHIASSETWFLTAEFKPNWNNLLAGLYYHVLHAGKIIVHKLSEIDKTGNFYSTNIKKVDHS